MNSQHFRYWMARLRPIARPQAWMPLLGAGMVSGFVWVAYHSPESLRFIGEVGGSEDSAAIGADIDSVSVLMQEMGDRPIDPGDADGKTEIQTDGSKTGGNPSGKTQATLLKPNVLSAYGMTSLLSNDSPTNNLPTTNLPTTNLPTTNLPTNSLLTSNLLTSNLLTSNLLTNDRSIEGTPSSANPATAQNALFIRNDGIRNDGLSARINPLAQAIDRMNAQSYGNPGVPIEGTGPIGNGPVWAGIPVNGTSALTTSTPPTSSGSGRSSGTSGGSYDNNAYNNNAYNTLTGAPSGVALPDPGIATPIAPIGVPIGPPVGLNSGMVTPFPVSPNETVSVPSEQVFSAPRPVPGRVIGGGTINTFSNP